MESYFIVHWEKSSIGPHGKPYFAEVVDGPYDDAVAAQIIARDRRESAYQSECWQRERGLYNGPYENNLFRAMTEGDIDGWRLAGIDVR